MGAPAPNEAAFFIRGGISRADVPGLADRVRSLLRGAGAEVAVCDVSEADCDAVTVDALARLQLVARRNGCRVRLRGACPDLLELVDFMGLGDVLR
jgi:ABC-type transporter Mla MlaB component